MAVFSPVPCRLVTPSGQGGELLVANLGPTSYSSADRFEELAVEEAAPHGTRRDAATQTNHLMSPQTGANFNLMQADALTAETSGSPVAGTAYLRALADNSGPEWGFEAAYPAFLAYNTLYSVGFWLRSDASTPIDAFIWVSLTSPEETAEEYVTLERSHTETGWTYHTYTFRTPNTGATFEAITRLGAIAKQGSAPFHAAADIWGAILNQGPPVYFFDGGYLGSWTGTAQASISTRASA